MSCSDPHSFADDTHASVKHYALDLDVDFATQTLSGHIRLELDRPAGGGTDQGRGLLAPMGPGGKPLEGGAGALSHP